VAEHSDALAALVARALRDQRDHAGDCEVAGFSGSGRCIEPAVAARFDGVFIDLVCAEHAARAVERGTYVAYPKETDR